MNITANYIATSVKEKIKNLWLTN